MLLLLWCTETGCFQDVFNQEKYYVSSLESHTKQFSLDCIFSQGFRRLSIISSTTFRFRNYIVKELWKTTLHRNLVISYTSLQYLANIEILFQHVTTFILSWKVCTCRTSAFTCFGSTWLYYVALKTTAFYRAITYKTAIYQNCSFTVIHLWSLLAYLNIYSGSFSHMVYSQSYCKLKG